MSKEKKNKINYKEIEDKVYNYKTKYKQGFIESEIEEILKEYPGINMNKYNDAMMGNTCMVDKNDGLIIYHCDIVKAIICGLENRDLRFEEWD